MLHSNPILCCALIISFLSCLEKHFDVLFCIVDVLDLSWSPGDQWLASCSIDNTVVIWNVDKFPEITARLEGHTSLVKVRGKCSLFGPK